MAIKSLGVDECVDYREQDVTEAVKDVDVVLDTLGGETSVKSLRVLRPGGIVVSILPVGSDDFPAQAERLGVRAVRMLVDASHSGMRRIAELVGPGSCVPRSRRLPARRGRRGAPAGRHRAHHGQARAGDGLIRRTPATLPIKLGRNSTTYVNRTCSNTVCRG